MLVTFISYVFLVIFTSIALEDLRPKLNSHTLIGTESLGPIPSVVKSVDLRPDLPGVHRN
jgi:hypothetical protein